MRLKKKNDLIITGIQPWDISIGSNCKNIAMELSKKHRVLYVNNPLDRVTKFREKNSEKAKKRIDVIKGRKDPVEQLSDNLWVLTPGIIAESINKIPFPGLFDYLNRRNNKRFADTILKAADKLDFREYLLFNDQNMFTAWYLKEYLKPLLSIYYIRDNLIKNPYWRKQGERLEPLLIKKSDLVVTNSIYYEEYAAKYNPNSHMVGQGCDTSLFDESVSEVNIPDDIKKIGRPQIGYVGYLTHRRLDIKLIEYIAKQKPEWNIVLVGPEDDVFKTSELHNLSNVHFMGSRDPEDLPGYVKSFDVAINPQVLNDATIGNYPRKIDEYLTIGKPTVATETKAMEYFRDVVYLARNNEDYIMHITSALESDSEDMRRKREETGKSHSWKQNVSLIEDHIHKTIEKNEPGK